MVDTLDKFPRPRQTNVAFAPEARDASSGHKLLCRKCRSFQRHGIEAVHREDGRDVVRVQCKTCKATIDYVLQETGLMPEPFANRVKQFAKRRALEILRSDR